MLQIISTSMHASLSLPESWDFNPHLSITPSSSFLTNNNSKNRSSTSMYYLNHKKVNRSSLSNSSCNLSTNQINFQQSVKESQIESKILKQKVQVKNKGEKENLLLNQSQHLQKKSTNKQFFNGNDSHQSDAQDNISQKPSQPGSTKAPRHKALKISFSRYASHRSDSLGALDGQHPNRVQFVAYFLSLNIHRVCIGSCNYTYS